MSTGIMSVLNFKTVAIYSGILCASWVFYNVFIKALLSPLRKIPGTSFKPLIGDMRSLMKGEAMEATLKLVQKHGPLCRYYFFFGLERLLVADPDIIKHITVTNCKNYIKPPSRMFLMREIFGEGLVLSEGAKHDAHKRLMGPSFNNASIRNMLEVFESRFKQLKEMWAGQIRKDKKAVIKIAEDVCRNTLDIIGETAFAYEFNCLQNPAHKVGQAFQRLLQGTGLSWRFMLPIYFKFPFPDVKRLKEDVSVMRNSVDNIISKKEKTLEKDGADDRFKKDVLGMMMLARDDSGAGLSKIELRDQVMTTMLAGHETTAQGIAWILLQLSLHQDIQNEVRSEINRVWAEGESLTWDLLQEMTYLECVVKETLRMFPPVPLTLREAVENDTVVYNGENYFIPKGTIILLTMGPMMRRPDLFENPEIFDPSRFLDGTIDKNFYKYMPFLVGPRMCLGYKFAMMEMKMAIAVLLRSLKYETLPGQKFKRKMRTTMRPDPPLELNVSVVQ